MEFEFKDLYLGSTKKRFTKHYNFFKPIFQLNTPLDNKIYQSFLQIITEKSIPLHDKNEPLDSFKHDLLNILLVEINEHVSSFEEQTQFTQKWSSLTESIVESYQIYCLNNEYIYGRKLGDKKSKHSITLQKIILFDREYPNAKQYLNDPIYRFEIYCFFYSNPESFKHKKTKQQYAIVQRFVNWTNYLDLDFIFKEMIHHRKISQVPREPYLRYVKGFWSILLQSQDEKFGQTKLKLQSVSRINYCTKMVLDLIEQEEGNHLSPLDSESMAEFKNNVVNQIDILVKFLVKTKKILV